MVYVCCKEFDGRGIAQNEKVNEGERLEVIGGRIVIDGRPLCYVTSENAHSHFAVDDDGKGAERFAATHRIMAEIERVNIEYGKAVTAEIEEKRKETTEGEEAQIEISVPYPLEGFFAAIAERPNLSKFMKDGYWSEEFFEASIADLEELESLLP